MIMKDLHSGNEKDFMMNLTFLVEKKEDLGRRESHWTASR